MSNFASFCTFWCIICTYNQSDIFKYFILLLQAMSMLLHASFLLLHAPSQLCFSFVSARWLLTFDKRSISVLLGSASAPEIFRMKVMALWRFESRLMASIVGIERGNRENRYPDGLSASQIGDLFPRLPNLLIENISQTKKQKS